MVCTIPKFLPIYKRYNRKFGAFCAAHDEAYMLRKNKFKADWELSRSIWLSGYKTIAILTYFFCATVGWYYWIK